MNPFKRLRKLFPKPYDPKYTFEGWMPDRGGYVIGWLRIDAEGHPTRTLTAFTRGKLAWRRVDDGRELGLWPAQVLSDELAKRWFDEAGEKGGSKA